MSDASWKAWERRVAALFGGSRRGAYTGGRDGGRSDVLAPGWSIECKLLSRPGYADLLEAARQAERAAAPTELPVAIVKRKRAEDADALVVLRLETFLAWFGPAARADDPSFGRGRCGPRIEAEPLRAAGGEA